MLSSCYLHFYSLRKHRYWHEFEQAERNVSPENQLETKEKRQQPRGTDLPRQQRYRKLSLLRNADFLVVIGDITGISIKLY